MLILIDTSKIAYFSRYYKSDHKKTIENTYFKIDFKLFSGNESRLTIRKWIN